MLRMFKKNTTFVAWFGTFVEERNCQLEIKRLYRHEEIVHRDIRLSDECGR